MPERATVQILAVALICVEVALYIQLNGRDSSLAGGIAPSHVFTVRIRQEY